MFTFFRYITILKKNAGISWKFSATYFMDKSTKVAIFNLFSFLSLSLEHCLLFSHITRKWSKLTTGFSHLNHKAINKSNRVYWIICWQFQESQIIIKNFSLISSLIRVLKSGAVKSEIRIPHNSMFVQTIMIKKNSAPISLIILTNVYRNLDLFNLFAIVVYIIYV